MIDLYVFPPSWGLPNASPFCVKLETYLRMAGLEYRTVYEPDPRKGPKGKMPFIVDQGRRIGDSGLVIDYLKATYGDPLDEGLNPSERAQALALQRLIEEHLYWCILHDRWIVEQHWRTLKSEFFDPMPALIRGFVSAAVRRKMAQALRGCGVGRHSTEEIYQLGADNIAALAAALGDRPYVFGDEATSIDATVFGTTCNLLWAPFDSPMRDAAMARQNIVDHAERMRNRYFAPAES